MDGFGHDVAQKIKAAIKAKLVELSAYVDDELPDYIMVMVANKKSKKAMTDDLTLFLNENTPQFTDWLHEVLNKLQSVTLESSKSHRKSPELKSKVKVSQNNTVTTSEKVVVIKEEPPNVDREDVTLVDLVDPSDEFLAIKFEQDTDDILDDELKGEAITVASVSAPEKSLHVVSHESSVSQPTAAALSKSLPLSQQQATMSNVSVVRPRASLLRVDGQQSAAGNVKSIESRSNGIKKTAVQSVSQSINEQKQPVSLGKKRKLPSSTVGAIVRRSVQQEVEDDDDDNRRYPNTGTVASVVQVSQRKSSVPVERQATKALLLKAVDEAHKSVLECANRKTERTIAEDLQFFTKNYLATIQQMKERSVTESKVPSATTEAFVTSSQNVRLKVPSNSPQPVSSPPSTEQTSDSTSVYWQQTEQDSSSNVAVDYSSTSQLQNDTSLESTRVSSPKFIITLDGVETDHGFSSRFETSDMHLDDDDDDDDALDIGAADDDLDLRGQLSPISSQEFMSLTVSKDDDMCSLDEDMSVEEVHKKRKIMEKCRYWPDCRNGDDCRYHHPTLPCRTFPNCKFGSHCLYIHPVCKFDSSCKRRDCSYTHSSKTVNVAVVSLARESQMRTFPPRVVTPRRSHHRGSVATVVPLTPRVLPTNTPQQVRCRKFPNCSNLNCPFLHPKPCRYGVGCTRTDCVFSHPPLPSRRQLKWSSSSSSQAETTSRENHISQRVFAVGNVEEHIVTPVET